MVKMTLKMHIKANNQKVPALVRTFWKKFQFKKSKLFWSQLYLLITYVNQSVSLTLLFTVTRNTHHHILEGFGHKERHAPVGKYTHSTGKPSGFDRENFWHDQPRDWTPTESKTWTQGPIVHYPDVLLLKFKFKQKTLNLNSDFGFKYLRWIRPCWPGATKTGQAEPLWRGRRYMLTRCRNKPRMLQCWSSWQYLN